MFNEFNLLQLDAERRKLFLERAAKARLLKAIKAGQPDFKCLICEKLAAFFLNAGKRLKALGEIKPGPDLPPIKSEDLRKLLEKQEPNGLFI
jgi:hypothetical protein